MVPSFLEVILWQVLKEESDIDEEPDVCRAAKEYLKTIKDSARVRRGAERQSPKNLASVQVFPPLIVQYISQSHMDTSFFFENARHFPCTLRSEHWLSFHNAFDEKALLAHEYGILEVLVRPSLMKHPDAGTGCFANQQFSKGKPVIFYYGTLVYKALSGTADEKVLGEGLMVVTALELCCSAIQLYTRLSCLVGLSHVVWLESAKFCATRLMNDPRRVVGEFSEEENAVGEARSASVLLDEKWGAGITTVDRMFLLFELRGLSPLVRNFLSIMGCPIYSSKCSCKVPITILSIPIDCSLSDIVAVV